MTTTSRRRLIVTGLTLAVLVALAACGGPLDTDTPSRVVIVTAPSADQPQPTLTTTDEAILRAAAGSSDGVAEIVVAGDPASNMVVGLTPRRQVGDGRTQVEHGPARDGLIDTQVTDVRERLAGLAPVVGAPDLLRAITDATRGGPPDTMIIADSGVSTVDPLDLRVLGWDGDPRAIVDDLARRGFVPDLRGWTVRWTSLGWTAGPQHALPEPQRRWLVDLWSELCNRAGATRCVVDEGAGPQSPPLSRRSAGPVPVPAVTTVAAGADTVSTFPAAALGFTEGSADLPDTAAGLLGNVVASARDGRHAVRVEGFVAFWGPDAYRQDLSERRARAVARAIVTGGVPAERITAVGRGAADGPGASQTSGRFDEAKVRAAGLRRVVVTVTPLPAP